MENSLEEQNTLECVSQLQWYIRASFLIEQRQVGKNQELKNSQDNKKKNLRSRFFFLLSSWLGWEILLFRYCRFHLPVISVGQSVIALTHRNQFFLRQAEEKTRASIRIHILYSRYKKTPLTRHCFISWLGWRDSNPR